MFGISIQELILIIFIGLMVIPPKEFPKILRFCLDTYKKIQKLYVQLLREINLMDM